MSSPSAGGGVRTDAGVRGQLERHADLPDDAPGRMLLLDGHPERLRLRRSERRHDVVDRPARDLGRVERGEPVRGRARREARRQDRAELARSLDPVAVRREARIVGQLRRTDRRAQPRPLALRADRDRDRAVGRRERLVRDDVRVGVAEPARRDAADERVLGLVDEAGQGRSEQRDVDPLAVAGDRGPGPLAPDERGQDARPRRASRSRRR